MTDEHIAQVERALAGLGNAWRGDWSDFDGRTLRAQLGGVETILRAEDPQDAADRWLMGNGVCREHACWPEHCPNDAGDGFHFTSDVAADTFGDRS